MATTYEYLKKNNHKIQVDSAIRDGEGKKISTIYAKKSQLANKQDDILTYIGGSANQVLARNSDNTELVFVNQGGGGEPAEYLKQAVVSEDNKTLTLTKKDGSTVAFTPPSVPSDYVRKAEVSGDNKTLTLTMSYGTNVVFTPPIPTVDQTYNAESENAQSGKAVAQAISTTLIDAILREIHTVGSYYISEGSMPDKIAAIGTWVKVEGRTILGSSASYSVGTEGGSATHTFTGTVASTTLTVDQIPSHSHSASSNSNGINPFASSNKAGSDSGALSAQGQIITVNATGGGQGHSHGFTGSSQNTLDPYRVVNIWRRTA